LPANQIILLQQVVALIAKELLAEWKQRYALGGILLYVVSTVFICKLCFRTIEEPLTWSALFWIIMLFAAVNAVAKSFLQESKGRLLYMYTLASPQAIILSRTIYNILLMLVLSLLCYGFYALLIGNLVENTGLFLCAVILGSMGFSCILTMVSAIASKTNNNFTLMAILSFPILLPLLLLLIRVSKMAIDNLEWSVSYKYLVALLAFNVIVTVLAWLLFPYLWRD
jgi:heme exporter protein B